MTHPTDKLLIENDAAIYLTPCPGTKNLTLDETIAQFAQQGIKGLVSLTPKTEMTELNVADMPAVCERYGITWFYAPVDDHQAPSDAFNQEWPSQKSTVHQLLDKGQSVALHCQGGQGRTGTLAAQLLIERGRDYEQAKAEIKAVKPGALTIAKQTDYLQALAK
ncbi:phosphatase domain-containing putative toxin [Algibacillus agarilyticus]|uniref:phosphatase domain-containing putative toxin n=1 Tax=Algibacillus agarilyticus TaxID=2234133 RepID=UPI000DCFA4D9|nr:tyrosine-protein phosphatase [Algibacillus agarilyticus]